MVGAMARHTTRRIYEALIGLTLVLQTGVAQSEVIRLEDLEQRALRSRSDLSVQSAKIQHARAEEELARSARRPTFTASAEGSLAPGGRLIEVQDLQGDSYLVSGARPFGDSDAFSPQPRYGAGIGAKATLFDFGRSGLQIDAAKARVGAAQAAVGHVKEQIVDEVRSAYADWLNAAQALQIANDQLARLKRWREVIDQLITEGVRPASDGALARYEEQRADLAALRARSAHDLARARLESATQTELPLTATPDPTLLDVSLAHDTSARDDKAASSNARYFEQERQAATLAARALDKTHAPVVGVGAEIGAKGQQDELFPVYRLSLSITAPLWDGGEQSARAAMARADASELKARLAQAQRLERQQLAMARARLISAEDELKAALEMLASAKLLLEQAEGRYQLGSAGVEPVIEAQHTLASAELDVLQAKLTRLDAELKLKKPPMGS
jgi:outer membrane protein TolC